MVGFGQLAVRVGFPAATDDNDLKNEGKGDQAKGNLKQVGEQAKDLFND